MEIAKTMEDKTTYWLGSSQIGVVWVMKEGNTVLFSVLPASRLWAYTDPVREIGLGARGIEPSTVQAVIKPNTELKFEELGGDDGTDHSTEYTPGATAAFKVLREYFSS